jgi:hypothetical protein
MSKLIAAILAVVALTVPPVKAAAGGLTLQPESFGEHTVASWRAQEGLPDSVGVANQALFLQKETFAPGPAAVAVVRGLEGVPVDVLSGLEWERRRDSECNATSPRWELVVRGTSGREYATRFGCRVAIHGPGSAPGWVRDSNPRALIRARLLLAGATDALTGQIESLAVVMDQRGIFRSAVLDNTAVTAGLVPHIWTCAADNGDAGGVATTWTPRTEPFTDADYQTFEDLWALLTPEEQELATSSG